MNVVEEFDRYVGCDMCSMWIEFDLCGLSVACDFDDVSADDFGFVCEKCSRLKVVEARLEALEVRLAEMQMGLLSSCEAEVSGVEVQQTENSSVDFQSDRGECKVDDEWSLVESGKGAGKGGALRVNAQTGVESSNSFEVLHVEEVTEGEVMGCAVDRVGCDEGQGEGNGGSRGSGLKGGKWAKSKVKGSALLVGDSLVRYADREFCRGRKSKRIRVCFPGARIDDVSSRVNQVVGNEEVVVVQVGTNNLGKDSSRLMKSKYREMMCRLKASRARIVCCGLFPRFDGKSFDGKIADFNEWLALVCSREEVDFLDTSQFQNRRDLFGRDGLHLSNVGALEFGRAVSKVVDRICLN